MISESHTRYGSVRSPGAARHGSLRRWRSYHASSSEDGGGPATARFRRTACPASVMASDLAEPCAVNKSRKSARPLAALIGPALADRSEEHTSELQSRLHLVCRLLLEKK